MANIELVIKLSEDSYKATCNGCMLPQDVENVVQGIKNGTPIPKGHGRLIDTDAIVYEKECVYFSDGSCTTESTPNISATPTIIEADKEVKD